MAEELVALHKTNTWDLVPLPPGNVLLGLVVILPMIVSLLNFMILFIPLIILIFILL